MQIPKNFIFSVSLLIIGVAIGALVTRNARPTKESGISVYESEVVRSMDLLSDISNGGQNAVKQHLESSFNISLRQINSIAKESSEAAERAKVVQQVVSKWRADNPAMNLGAELSKEIQNASNQIRK